MIDFQNQPLGRRTGGEHFLKRPYLTPDLEAGLHQLLAPAGQKALGGSARSVRN